MSGLFKRFSSRRSAGPEGTEPPAAAEPGTADVPANASEPEGHRSLLRDPAAPTRVLRAGEQPAATTSGDPLETGPNEPASAEPPVDPAGQADRDRAAAPDNPARVKAPEASDPSAPPVHGSEPASPHAPPV